MIFTAPSLLWWSAIALPIIGLYILRTRPRRHVVTTLLFWDQVFDDRRQRAWWRNLRRWLSLLLQLIFVALVVLALADLVRTGQTERTETVLVIDNSASMNAAAASGGTRLDLAKERGRRIAGGLRPGDSMAVVTAGSTVNVAAGLGDFAPAVIEAIDQIPPTDGPTRIEEAIAAAERLTVDPKARRIIVITDQPPGSGGRQGLRTDVDQSLGGFGYRRGDQSLGGFGYRIMVGQSLDNVAITTMSVRRSLVDPLGYACWVEVQSFADSPVQTRLSVRLQDELVDVYPIDLQPGGTWQQTIQGVSRAGGVMTATLEGTDGLAADNVASAVLSPRRPVPVTLVTAEGREDSPAAFFLQSVLGAIPLVDLSDLSPDDDNASDRLTVYVGVVPESFPTGPALYIDPPTDGPGGAWRLGQTMPRPIVVEQDNDSPLLRHVRLVNVPLDSSRELLFDPDDPLNVPIIQTDNDAAVALVIDRPAGRVLVLSTTLDQSDLPLRVAFPVMMTNAINWFTRRGADLQSSLHTGEPQSMTWDGAAEVRVRTVPPAGDPIGPPSLSLSLTDDRQIYLPAFDRVGVLELTTDQPGDRRQLSVNLCDPVESDLRMENPGGDEVQTASIGWRPIWWMLVCVAAGLILIEWSLYQRRVVA